MSLKWRRKALVRGGTLAATLVAATLVIPEPAHASECGWILTEVTRGGLYVNYRRGWEITGRAPVTLSFTRPLTYRNDLAATVTLDPVVTSGRLGFPVGTPQVAPAPSKFQVPADGRIWKLQAGTLDRQVTFNIRDRCTRRLAGTGRVTETLKIVDRRLSQGVTARTSYKHKGCSRGHR